MASCAGTGTMPPAAPSSTTAPGCLSGVARPAFKLRAELVERGFALILDRGGMRRAWLRGRENLHKRYLIHVAGYNLGLDHAAADRCRDASGVPGRVSAWLAAAVTSAGGLFVLLIVVAGDQIAAARHQHRARPLQLNGDFFNGLLGDGSLPIALALPLPPRPGWRRAPPSKTAPAAAACRSAAQRNSAGPQPFAQQAKRGRRKGVGRLARRGDQRHHARRVSGTKSLCAIVGGSDVALPSPRPKKGDPEQQQCRVASACREKRERAHELEDG